MFRADSTCPHVLRIPLVRFAFRLRESHPLRYGFPSVSSMLRFLSAVLYPKAITGFGLASFAFARHYSRNLVWFLFLRLLRCFSSAGSPAYTMYSCMRHMVLSIRGFPIRTPTDLAPICGSPWLIAACRVLLRLLVPRHSPCALLRLNFCTLGYASLHNLLFSFLFSIFILFSCLNYFVIIANQKLKRVSTFAQDAFFAEKRIARSQRFQWHNELRWT